MKIFKPKNSDVPKILELWKEAKVYHYNLDPEYYASVTDGSMERLKRYVAKAIKTDKPNILIARIDDKIAGFITFEKSKEEYSDTNIKKPGLINELLVTENYRGKGVGMELMKAVEQYFKDQGLQYVKLECSSYNSSALSFYDHFGYKNRQLLLYKKL